MTRMTRALAVLLTRAIDYAGMFPPAKLELASALDNYSRYREGAEEWILGRFVVPASQLESLASMIVDQPPTVPLPVSVVGRGGSDRSSWESGLETDAADTQPI